MLPREVIGIIFACIAVVLLIILIATSRKKKVKLSAAEKKGQKGEDKVKAMLEQIAGTNDRIINNVLFELEPGNSCQIDHIFINQSGIYVIETKSHASNVYEKDGQFREYYYKSKTMCFEDPRKQNIRHVLKLSEKLLIPQKLLHPVVVYVNSNEKNIKIPYVYTEKNFGNAFDYTSKVLSPAEIDYYYKSISYMNNSSAITLEQHKNNYN